MSGRWRATTQHLWRSQDAFSAGSQSVGRCTATRSRFAAAWASAGAYRKCCAPHKGPSAGLAAAARLQTLQKLGLVTRRIPELPSDDAGTVPPGILVGADVPQVNVPPEAIDGLAAYSPSATRAPAQGDSELCGTAIEMSLTGTFQLILHKQNTLSGSLAGLTYPLLETQDEWVLHGFSFANYLAELGPSGTAGHLLKILDRSRAAGCVPQDAELPDDHQGAHRGRGDFARPSGLISVSRRWSMAIGASTRSCLPAQPRYKALLLGLVTAAPGAKTGRRLHLRRTGTRGAFSRLRKMHGFICPVLVQTGLAINALEPIPKVVDSDKSFVIRYAASKKYVDWGVPRCGNLNIAALLSGVVCDIRVT